jgi:hypothetical protein
MTNSKEIRIAPENLAVANAYLEVGNITDVAQRLQIPTNQITEILDKREVKAYVDAVYLDSGYRNRDKIAQVLDQIIDDKLEEMLETELTSKKDIAELLQIAMKFRESTIKEQLEEKKALNQAPSTQINIDATNPFGDGNYGELMKKLINNDDV